MKDYPLIALGEVLKFSADEVGVEPHNTYQPVGIYSFGRGLFARPAIPGTETKYKKFYRLHEGQLVYGRLNAWEGAVGIVTSEFDGMHVSQEFPTFDVDPDRALPSYLGWVCQWEPFWDALMRTARGMGSRAGARRLRVHPEQFLSVAIPLPALDEQRRVVESMGRFHSLTARIESKLRQAESLARALMESLVDGTARRVTFGELLTRVKRAEVVQSDQEYRLLGMRWYAEGLFVKERRLGAELAARTLYRVEEGDFVYNRLFAWKGSFAIADLQHEGSHVSGEFPTFEIDESQADPGYLMAFFRKSSTWEEAEAQSRGSTPTSRNRLKEEQFLAMELPLPPLPTQTRIANQVSGVLRGTALHIGHWAHLEAAKLSILNRTFGNLQ